MRSRLPLLVVAASAGPLLLLAIPSAPPPRGAPMLQPVVHPVGNPPTAAKVTPAERQDLLAFLEALSSEPLDTIPRTVPSQLTPGGTR